MLTGETDLPRADAAVTAPAPPGGLPPIPPLGIRQALLFSLASVGTGMVFAFFNAQLPLYLRGYGVSHQLIGPLTNERSFAGALVLPFVGRWSDRAQTRWGKRRPFFLVGVPLMAGALVLLGSHPPFWLMFTTVLVAGGFLFIALGPYQALMADITPAGQRGQMGGFMALAGMAGAILVSVLAALLWPAHSELVFFATAAVLLLSFALTFLTVCEPAHHYEDSGVWGQGSGVRGQLPDGKTASRNRGAGSGPSGQGSGAGDVRVVVGVQRPDGAIQNPGLAPSLRSGQALERSEGSKTCPERSERIQNLKGYMRDVLQHRQVARYIAVMSLYWLAAGGATPFITLYGTETLGLKANQASLLFLVLVLSTAAGTVLVGPLADRVGKKRVLHVGLGVFALAALWATTVQDAGQALPVMILAGLGNACPTTLGVPLLADLMPRERSGEFIGLGSFVWSVVQPLGAFLAGYLVDQGHSDRWAFGFAGVFMALAVLALFAVRPGAAANTGSW